MKGGGDAHSHTWEGYDSDWNQRVFVGFLVASDCLSARDFLPLSDLYIRRQATSADRTIFSGRHGARGNVGSHRDLHDSDCIADSFVTLNTGLVTLLVAANPGDFIFDVSHKLPVQSLD